VIGNRLKQVQDRLKLYYEAEIAVLTSQSYTIGKQTLTRANLKEIRSAIAELESLEKSLSLSNGKRVCRRVIPRDL